MEKEHKGKILLEKLKQVVHQADINSKQAIQSACHSVEQTIEVLHGRKKKLEDAYKERTKLLEQSVKSCRLDEDIKEVSLVGSVKEFVEFCPSNIERFIWSPRNVSFLCTVYLGFQNRSCKKFKRKFSVASSSRTNISCWMEKIHRSKCTLVLCFDLQDDEQLPYARLNILFLLINQNLPTITCEANNKLCLLFHYSRFFILPSGVSALSILFYTFFRTPNGSNQRANYLLHRLNLLYVCQLKLLINC